MTVREFLESKTVKLDEIKEAFIEERHFDHIQGHEEDKCLNCGDKYNFQWIKSEPWLSVQYCGKCNRLNAIIRADLMGGSNIDGVYVFKNE